MTFLALGLELGNGASCLVRRYLDRVLGLGVLGLGELSFALVFVIFHF
jgi:hypothetical protein